MDRERPVEYGRAKRAPRVSSACQRCRRQKLKCDRERPCALCTRSGVICISENRPTQRRRRGGNRNAANNAARTPREVSVPVDPLDGNVVTTLGSAIITPERDLISSEELSNDALKYQSSGDNVSGWFGPNARTSSAGMTQEIIDQFSPKTILASSTSALPGGSRSDDVLGNHAEKSRLIETFDFEFPLRPVADFLLETYLGAVHWFMMVFHEPTFRNQYESILDDHSSPKSNSKLLLIILVLSLGAHYTTDDRVKAHSPTFDLEKFREKSLAKVKERLWDLLDDSDVESVQVCVLLGSFYLYHGRPNLAYVVLGAGIRCSQIMGLDKESSWRRVSEMEKEERRRTFWALFVFDRFASIVYGKPCSIQREGIDVKMPQNLGDTTIQHPHFHSVASMPDGTTESVTSFTYVKFKIQLYQLASPIVADVYFHRNSDPSILAARVMKIDRQLRTWFTSLPPELKLQELCRQGMKETPQNARIFMLQALALQLAYDNVKILLHRPSLSQNILNMTPGPAEENSPQNRDGQSFTYTREAQGALLTSRDNCWESAIQSSRLGIYGQCLEYARETHAAAFLGINLFTASMVLCVFALSNPISTQAQLAKQAVTRVMSLSRFLANRSILSGQTNLVLRDLVNLILEKERKVMLFADKEPLTSRPNYNQMGVASKETIPMNTLSPMPSEAFEEPQEYRSLSQSPFEDPNAPFSASLLANVTGQIHDIPDFANLDFDDGIATLQEGMLICLSNILEL
ncbi:uncharacterized protein N7483_001165 [Penicillium malachiteum]|uniref:uncharacterized protein n=1 Tax=Penicillium malachiteum TaxID=1324776 RepID=UPI002549762E|nr:uncharacterized protein N7483_001165 [Penicillium malachiteum]KAJ5736040.1 hypothetical protein N7483_001165 [Penicillium malachiteum]